MKKYEIYRYAYVDETEMIEVPDDTKFYLLGSAGIKKVTDYGVVMQNDYIAVMNYNKQLFAKLELRNQGSISMDLYNIGKKYIFIILRNVYPLSKKFPLTKEAPIIDTFYVKTRVIPKSTNKSIFDTVKEGMSEEEIKDILMPAIYYHKVNGFDVDDKNYLDVTNIVVGSQYNDDMEVMEIERNSFRIHEIFPLKTSRLKVEPSTKEEFEKRFNELIKKF